MDGWINEQMDGWMKWMMNELKNGWLDRWTNELSKVKDA